MNSAHTLTKRERQILLLVIEEYTSLQIAQELKLSVRTVETHRRNIMQKTSCKTLIALIKFAIKAGLLEGFCFIAPARRPGSPP